MYYIPAVLFLLFSNVECASYQRYGESSSQYPSYSTISNLYNQNQNSYTPSSYGSDVARFPEVTRYPNYNLNNPEYTTPKYNSYNSYSTVGSSGYNPSGYNPSGYNPSGYNPSGYSPSGYNPSGYTTPGYGGSYGSQSNVYGSGNDAYGRQGYSSYEMPFMRDIRDYCINRTPQTEIWVDSLMGMWYGAEFIHHLAGDSRVDYSKSCIVIHLSEPVQRPSTENTLFHVQHINAKFRQEYRHLRLLWDENGQTTEYALYFRNDSVGYWQVLGNQNGTLTNLPNYQQFSGSVQVLKAVNDHLVLNFCQEPTNGRQAQLYTVLFSREPGMMPRWEIESVHTMLQTKKLSLASRRMVCGNSAPREIAGFISLMLSIVLSYNAFGSS